MQAQPSSQPTLTVNSDGSRHKRNNLRSTQTFTYSLPRHVFVCQTQDCVVFLDARRDKYMGVGGDEGQALSVLLEANSCLKGQKAHHQVSPSISPQLVTLLDALVAKGLLAVDPIPGKPFQTINLDAATCAVGMGTEYEHVPGLTHILSALIAHIGARFELHFRGVSGTVARLQAEKEREFRADRTNDIDELQRLISIFRVIRPFLYTKKNQCLLHGLTVHRFLRWYGFNPTWVIGIDIAPFKAHCWVQQNDRVLDDSPEHTLEFTPVVAI